MNIAEIFGRGAPVYSFEFFLPKSPQDMEGFFASLRELKSLRPSFVTLTYGAGGSARQQTVEAAGRIKRELGLDTVCHLTCITHTRAEIAAILDRLASHGIDAIVALRGDQPKDGPVVPVASRDFGYARELVEFIKRRGGFSTAVAGYPETHPEAASPEDDLKHLAEKVRAGADWVITQLFFDSRDYFAFVARARAAGITVPIVPGIMPVTGYAQLKRFTALCGAKLPAAMLAELEAIHEDPAKVIAFGVDHATKQCRELLAGGAPGIHFYTLNKSHSTSAILENLRKKA